jgi:iron(III) transport system substrate-binding protein
MKKLFLLMAVAVLGIVIVRAWWLNSKTTPEVVVYVSEDQVFSEPILKDFERDAGIRVRAVFDTEEAKSTGVMNRLIAEKNNPQADVYWANEPVRAELLKQLGLAEPYQSPTAEGIPSAYKDPDGYWTGFSARARVLIVNNRVTTPPASLVDYTALRFKGKTVIANPLFGTTGVEMAALFTLWGDERAAQFLEAMTRNAVKISTSNGESADLVASGEFDFSLVDSDDAVNRTRQGKPVRMIYPDQGETGAGMLILPNAAVIIHGAPHVEQAKRLVDYLLSKETERKLAFADCAQLPLHPGVETPPDVPKLESIKTMRIDYAEVARKLRDIQPLLTKWAGY